MDDKVCGIATVASLVDKVIENHHKIQNIQRKKNCIRERKKKTAERQQK